MSQTITGWAKMHQNIQRFFRAQDNPGLVDDQSVADALTEAQDALADLVLEAGVGWLIKTALVDDVGQSLGSGYGEQGRFLFMEQDLGLTDVSRIQKLYRQQNSSSELIPLQYLSNVNEGNKISSPAWYRNIGAGEAWIESGDVNDDGNHEMGIRVFNWNTASTNAQLRIDYWFTPAEVDPEWFTEVDAFGDLTRKPDLPRQMWPFILNYAKLVLAEQTGDQARLYMLRNRLNGRTGITERVQGQLANFQSATSEHVEDVY